MPERKTLNHEKEPASHSGLAVGWQRVFAGCQYTPGRCEHIIPARIPQAAAEQIATWSKKAYTVLNCKGFARVDFMLTEKGEPLILELNTVPGFTEMSLVPDAARAAGVKFTDLVERIVQLAQENYNGR